MFLAILILVSALSISATAIYFSIVGLTTIFPGAFWPIVIMGTVLEVGKLVCASWLHHHWKTAPRLLKIYLTAAVAILIFITSMGIFGFLSKSHIEQQRELTQTTATIEQLESQIANEQNFVERQQNLISKTEKREGATVQRTDFNIELEQKKIKELQGALGTSIAYDEDELKRLDVRLTQLDDEIAALEATSGGLFSNKKKKLEELSLTQQAERDLIQTKKDEAEGRIKEARVNTEKQIRTIRQRIDAFQDTSTTEITEDPNLQEYEENIRAAYLRIENLQAKKFSAESEIANLEVEVGPIKYIAALVEDMGIDNVVLAEAVRFVILILVFVFDPLAVGMLLAANLSLRKARQLPYEKLSDQITSPSSKVTGPISPPPPSPPPPLSPSSETSNDTKKKSSPGIYHDL